MGFSIHIMMDLPLKNPRVQTMIWKRIIDEIAEVPVRVKLFVSYIKFNFVLHCFDDPLKILPPIEI